MTRKHIATLVAVIAAALLVPAVSPAQTAEDDAYACWVEYKADGSTEMLAGPLWAAVPPSEIVECPR